MLGRTIVLQVEQPMVSRMNFRKARRLACRRHYFAGWIAIEHFLRGESKAFFIMQEVGDGEHRSHEYVPISLIGAARHGKAPQATPGASDHVAVVITEFDDLAESEGSRAYSNHGCCDQKKWQSYV